MQSALHARPVLSPTVSGRQLPPLFIVPLLLAATALPRFVSREPSPLPMSARVRLRVVRGPSVDDICGAANGARQKSGLQWLQLKVASWLLRRLKHSR